MSQELFIVTAQHVSSIDTILYRSSYNAHKTAGWLEQKYPRAVITVHSDIFDDDVVPADN